jgi:hypothetical protein
MSIRCTTRHGLTGNIPASAGAIINHDSLAEQRPHTFCDQPCGDISGTRRRERDHQAQGPRWKTLRPRNGRHGQACD